jgi:RimJ/RimL family protein N-acetyltransferase
MTRRTVMLPATTNDLLTLSALWNDARVRPPLFDGQAAVPAHARRLLEAGLAEAQAGLGWWLVHPWSNDPVLGCVGLLRSQGADPARVQPGEAVEALIAFSPKAWVQGYAHEAMEELVAHAVHHLRLRRLSARSSVPDPLFEGLLKTLGFEVRRDVNAGRRSLRLFELTAAAGSRAVVRKPQPAPRSAVSDEPTLGFEPAPHL